MKNIIKILINRTPLRLSHIGNYIRRLYFWRSVKILPIKNFKKILDADCGEGHYARKMALRFPWAQVIGMDIKPQDFKDSGLSNLSFIQEDLRELKEKDAYDFIYSIDVLEHIPKNEEVITNFFQALKKGGYLYLHVPYDVRRRHFFPEKYFVEFDKWKTDEHKGEQYSLERMSSVIRQAGFEIVKAEHTFGSIGMLAWELDRVTDKKIVLKGILMPILKLLGQISVRIKHKSGNILLLARKK
ncbi:MAG: class I SAM-dependent methyltransferase [Candidatus Omnitrophota bacterium]